MKNSSIIHKNKKRKTHDRLGNSGFNSKRKRRIQSRNENLMKRSLSQKRKLIFVNRTVEKIQDREKKKKDG